MLVGRNIEEFSRILDFGCGTARVVRWFRELLPTAELHGTDINGAAIRWSKANVSGVRFATNNHLPPLPFADGSIDLIFGISVLTHLDEGYQDVWLEELHRVTRPGSIIMLSVEDRDCAPLVLSDEELQILSAEGFYYKQHSDPTIDDLPDLYQTAFHTRSYITSHWPTAFQVLLHLKHGPLYQQSLVVMRRLGPMNADAHDGTLGIREIDLPIVCLDASSHEQVVRDGTLVLDGWGFYPRGGRSGIGDMDRW